MPHKNATIISSIDQHIASVFHFDSSGDAYDECMWNEDIKLGSIIVVAEERIVGVATAYPIAVTQLLNHHLRTTPSVF